MIILARKLLPVSRPDIDHGALVIKGKKIADIGRQREIIRKYPGMKVLDLGGCILMPGLVNLHTHLDLSHLHGMLGEREDFFEWIGALVELKKSLGERGARKAASTALCKAVSAGTTCVGDISSSEAAIPGILKSGVRAVVFLEAIGLDGLDAHRIFDRLKTRLDSLKRSPGRISLGISPHAPYSVSRRLYEMIAGYTSCNDLILCIHLSETLDETLYIKGKPSGFDRYMKMFGWDKLEPNRGATSLRFLKEFGFQGGLIAVHAVHASKGDMEVLRNSGTSVAYCPRSNHYLKVGKAPVEEFLSRGVNVGLGTDSLASNMDLNLWEEMRFAYLVNKVKARKIIEMATINGAMALGLGPVAGSLEPGKEADMVAVRTDASKSPHPCLPLLMDTSEQDVMMTMVEGTPIHLSKDMKCQLT